MLNLYVGWFEKKKKCFYPKQLEEEFSGLYPGVNIRKQIKEYYLKKIKNAIKFGIVGFLIALLCICKQVMNGDLKDDRYLERGSVGGGDKQIALDAEIGDERIEDVVIVLGEQEITESAKRKLLEEIEKQLEEKIKGTNK